MAQPCIIYALVARQTVVLAEYNGSIGNASTVALKILDKLANSSNGNRASYLVDHHAFHVLVSENMIYLAMTTQVRVGFACWICCATLDLILKTAERKGWFP